MALPDSSGTLADVLGFLFACISFVAYYKIVQEQFTHFKRSTSRIQILSTRTALFLPIYVILMCTALVRPRSFQAVQVLIAVTEGYSFYCFFVLLVSSRRTTLVVLLKFQWSER